MAGLNKLTKIQIDRAKRPTVLRDGGGLQLRLSDTGAGSWVFRFRFNGKRPETGLGSYPDVSLAEARAKAQQAREWLKETPQRDPRVEWAAKAKVIQKPKNAPVTFGEFVESELPRMTARLSNAKHKAQWGSTLRKYCFPIWSKSLAEIDGEDVADCIAPQWRSKHETMRRVRGRMENMFDAATAKRLFTGDNPARWSLQKHFVADLSREEKRKRHHRTHHYADMPEFWLALAAREANSARALQFALLTAGRSQVVRGARWTEMDFENRIWNVPENRMKAGLPHFVPLSDQAIDLLEAMPRMGDSIFYNDVRGGQLGANGMRALLLRMGDAALNRDGELVTAHGCARSAFKDWAGDETPYDDQISEFALAHVGTSLFKSYRHKTAVEKRRGLMQAWADFLTRRANESVVPIRAA